MSVVDLAQPEPLVEPKLSAADVTAPPLRESFALCRSITRSRARNFYYGLKLTPEPKRAALFAVYAWMRAADDIADQPLAAVERTRRMEAFAARTRAVFETGQPPAIATDADVWWPAFAAIYRGFALEPACFEAALGGVEEDARDGGDEPTPTPRYESREELREYCARVASSVGVLCLRIWGVRDGVAWADAREMAVTRGLAFQLTNILRDFAEDYDEGRVYLPGEEFRAAGLDPPTMRDWSDGDACALIVRKVAGWAREAYQTSAQLDQIVHPDGRPAM
jgi:15-cis-phytoene synthase